MADQLYGTDGAGEGLDAASLRADATRYMEANEGDFAPFVEDDEAIGDYLRRMRQAGCWGGNMELTSLSQMPPAGDPHLSAGRGQAVDNRRWQWQRR